MKGHAAACPYFVDFIFEKPRPAPKSEGRIVGMDSNYKNGFVFSDGQIVGSEIHPRIQSFEKRQKHTHAEIKSIIGCALKKVDFSGINVLCMEDLRYVKQCHPEQGEGTGNAERFRVGVGLKPTPTTGGCPIGSMLIPFSCWNGTVKFLGFGRSGDNCPVDSCPLEDFAVLSRVRATGRSPLR